MRARRGSPESNRLSAPNLGPDGADLRIGGAIAARLGGPGFVEFRLFLRGEPVNRGLVPREGQHEPRALVLKVRGRVAPSPPPARADPPRCRPRAVRQPKPGSRIPIPGGDESPQNGLTGKNRRYSSVYLPSSQTRWSASSSARERAASSWRVIRPIPSPK